MGVKGYVRNAIVGFVAGVVAFGIAPAAFAVAYSGWTNFGAFNGITYQGNSFVDTSGTPYGADHGQG